MNNGGGNFPPTDFDLLDDDFPYTQQQQQQQIAAGQHPEQIQWSNPFSPQQQQQYQHQQFPQQQQSQRQPQQNAFIVNPQHISATQPPMGHMFHQPPQNFQPRAPPKAAAASAALSKKRKPAQQTVPRKRTMMACDSCRLKKVKCDLQKPVCGSCVKNGATCMYRQPPSSRSETDVLSAMANSNSKNSAPTWSSCNWYSKGDGLLKWPIFEEKFKTKAINAILANTSQEGMPKLRMFSQMEMNELSHDLKENMNTYSQSFLMNVSTKDPFINTKTLLRSVDYVKKCSTSHPDLYLFDLEMPDELLPMPVLIQCCAVGLMSRPLTFSTLIDYKTSQNEKSDIMEHSYKLMIMANLLNSVPKTNIPDFNLGNVQLYILQCMFWMYNMKPLKAWEAIFKASTTVMTILETYKSSGRKFSELEHRILDRVFHSCVKYESELRVELSPSVPSSGIVNYQFPSIYPTPPLDGTLSMSDEVGWFFYLTEIVLRKLENRFLDEFYVPLSSTSDSGHPTGKFIEDDYTLDWGKYDVATIIEKTSVYLEDLAKIEKSIVTHLKPIVQDQNIANELQPQGFVMKPVSSDPGTSSVETSPQSMASQTNYRSASQMSKAKSEDSAEKIPLTPSSESSSSNVSQRAEFLAPKVPEVINFIKTRMIAFKIVLFRPLTYLILHDTVASYDNPFIDEVLRQTVETTEMVNVPLATHRHFGSWFYLRNLFISGMVVYAFYLRFRERFSSKEKVEDLLKNIITIYDYWIDETPDLEDSKRIINSLLEELKDL